MEKEKYSDCPKCGNSIFDYEDICPSCSWARNETEVKRKYGYLRQDDDGHWYLIPEEMIKNFSNLEEQIENEEDWEKKDFLISLFIEAFDTYRLSGGYQDLRISME